MKVLITSPSLLENDNVSGISTLVRNLIDHGRHDYVHFAAGRKDRERRQLGWLARQAALPFDFVAAIKSSQPDLIHLNTAFIAPAIVRDALLAAAAAKRPILLHIHGGPFVLEPIRNRALNYFARRSIESAKSAVVFSQREALALAPRYPKAKIDVLPNSVPPDARAERGSRKQSVRTIIFFGRLNKSKGLGHIAETVEILRSRGAAFEFVCFGDGPERKWFLEKMSSMLGPNFRYGGVAKSDAKWAELAAADIFFLPSRDEGLPLALLEAMMAGCVPVVSASGAVADVVENKTNGFVIDPHNAAATADTLELLLKADESVLVALRQNARRTVCENFNFDQYLDRLDNLYRQVVLPK